MSVAPAAAAAKDAKQHLAVNPAQLSRRRELRHSLTARARGVRLLLSQRSFVWVWTALLGVHVLNGLAAFGTAQLYFFISDPEIAFKFAALQIPTESLRCSGWAFAAVAAAHSLVLLRMVLCSLRHRQLMFRSPHKVLLAPGLDPPASSSPLQRAGQRLHALWRCLRRPWDALFGRNGYFGLNGSLFEVGFEAREALEIALQTYQAFVLSRSVSRRWINSLAVLAIVMNCCTTPLAHLALRGTGKTHTRRVLCLLADMVLDTCCALVIPFSIALPYWSEYNPRDRDFPNTLYYDDVWYINAIAEGRYILITSLTDYISTLAPHVSILTCLLTIESLLQRAPTRVAASPSPVQVVTAAALEPRRETVPTMPTMTAELRAQQHQRWRWCSGKLRSTVHAMFIMWGLCVGSWHLYAQMNGWHVRSGCKLHVSAWFTKQFPCSVMEVNCYRQQIEGSAAQIASMLHDLDRDALRTLIVTHCPALHMPPSVQEFSLMGGIEVFNCSIESWGADAAVHVDFHERISYAYVMYSNVSAGIPAGLLHAKLPSSFSYVYFMDTNLSALPEDIDVHWGDRDWVFLGFHKCQLEHVPPAFARLDSLQIVLALNEIDEVPVNLLERRALSYIDLSGNPLRALPNNFEPGDRRDTPLEIDARSTHITAIPTWLRDWAATHEDPLTKLMDTPYCDAAAARNDSADVTADAELQRKAAAQLCRDPGPETLIHEVILAQRQP